MRHPFAVLDENPNRRCQFTRVSFELGKFNYLASLVVPAFRISQRMS